MAGPWDSLMKRLVGAKPEHYVQWLAETATFVRSLDVELKAQHLYADALLQILVAGVLGLLHIEFQTDYDPDMRVRLLEYNVLASRQYDRCDVTSYVICLRQGTEIAPSPLIRTGFDGRPNHHFYFRVIKLWEVPAEVLLQLGWVGLLPLVTLAKGGKRPEVVKIMIDTLISAGEIDLLAMSHVLGGLAFKQGSERDAFKRRFAMLQDILRESWVYQEIGEEFREEFFEKGREEGREQGLLQGLAQGREEGKLEAQRQTIMSFVQTRFAELAEMAKQHTDTITDPDVLQALTTKLFAAQTVKEAQRMLVEAGKH